MFNQKASKLQGSVYSCSGREWQCDGCAYGPKPPNIYAPFSVGMGMGPI